MDNKLNVIIDTDPGVDDAIALMCAFNNEKFNILLITSAGGNGPIENITSNAIFLTELFRQNIPVAQGTNKPIVRPAKYALGAQGKNGFGKFKYNKNKLKHKPVSMEAYEAMYEVLRAHKDKTSIISIGPMTNIAKLLINHPDAKDMIKEIIFESGTKEKIYGVPYKSFNVGYDPEAAEVVFKSGVPLVMIPMEMGHFAYLDHADIKRFKKANRIGKVYGKMFDGYRDYHVGDAGAAVHDAVTIYYLTHPEYMKFEKGFIEIKYYKDETHDFGYVDINFEKKPNAIICMDFNINVFKYDIFDILENRLRDNGIL